MEYPKLSFCGNASAEYSSPLPLTLWKYFLQNTPCHTYLSHFMENAEQLGWGGPWVYAQKGLKQQPLTLQKCFLQNTCDTQIYYEAPIHPYIL